MLTSNGMVLTSWLFLLTGLYAYVNNQYIFAIVNFLVWYVSILNWSCMFQCPNWEMLVGIDRWVAHMVFLFYVYKGTQVIDPFTVFFMVNSVMFAFLLSCANFKLDSQKNIWKYNHILILIYDVVYEIREKFYQFRVMQISPVLGGLQ